MKRRCSRAEVLSAWLSRRARREGRIFALEEALLTGHFMAYAARRLAAFALARSFAIFIHLVEFTLLAWIFQPKALLASLVVKNACVVVGAWNWGALEALRRRLRELGSGSEAAALLSDWLHVAFGGALLVLAVPVAWLHHRGGEPTIFDAYASVYALRVACDIVLRTYYSGIFAFRRVHRPAWSVFVGPSVVVVATLLLYGRYGAFSFVVAIGLQVVVTRTLFFVFTRRAYRRHRYLEPTLSFRVARLRRAAARAFSLSSAGRRRGRLLGPALLGAMANVGSRLGSVVMLAALVPPLAFDDGPFDEPVVEPFSFAMHLAAPVLFVVSQWAFVFYHDYKRLEIEAAGSLSRQLDRRMLVLAMFVALVAWTGATAIVCVYIPWDDCGTALVALFVAIAGTSLWSALELRSFARGEFLRQVAAAACLLAGLWAALSSRLIEVGYLALAIGPWLSVGVYVVSRRLDGKSVKGEVAHLATFARALAAVKGEVRVTQTTVTRRPSTLSRRIASLIGPRGVVFRAGRQLLWFERAPLSSPLAIVATGAGTFEALSSWSERSGREALARLESRGVLARADGDLDAAIAAHARLFPSGFVLRIGRPAPPAFLALPPPERQALWRDAVRVLRGAKPRGKWSLWVCAPNADIVAVFVSARSASPDARDVFRQLVGPLEWRMFVSRDDVDARERMCARRDERVAMDERQRRRR